MRKLGIFRRFSEPDCRTICGDSFSVPNTLVVLVPLPGLRKFFHTINNTDSGTAYKNYKNGIAAGRDRLSGLRNELTQLIKDDDDRWYAFGFDKPSDPSPPEVPANLTAVAGAAGSKTVIADWDDARRADSYRLRAVT